MLPSLKDFLEPETQLVPADSNMAQSSPDGIQWRTPTSDY